MKGIIYTACSLLVLPFFYALLSHDLDLVHGAEEGNGGATVVSGVIPKNKKDIYIIDGPKRTKGRSGNLERAQDLAVEGSGVVSTGNTSESLPAAVASASTAPAAPSVSAAPMANAPGSQTPANAPGTQTLANTPGAQAVAANDGQAALANGNISGPSLNGSVPGSSLNGSIMAPLPVIVTSASTAPAAPSVSAAPMANTPGTQTPTNTSGTQTLANTSETQPIIANTPQKPSEIPPNRKVMGDSQTPLIDLSSVETVTSMALTEGDPADRLPWKTAEYYHFAKNQELKELIRNFCVMQSMDVIVSDKVADVVNGKFSNVTPHQFWKDITNAYGLVWFFDGSMMYVYKSDEVSSSVYQMNRDEMRTLVKVISQLGFLSSNVTFRPLETAGILVVSGPPKLMSLIEELSKKIVIERVSNVYDIRSFPLKHAWAYDMQVNYRGGSMNIPGVATMLQQMVGAITGPVGESSIGLQIDNSKANGATATKAIPGTAYHAEKAQKDSSETKDVGKTAPKNGEKNPLNLSDIFVTFDTRLNAVIVKAKRQDMPFIEGIIQQLDVSRDALKIEIAVVDITKSGSLKIRSQLAANRRIAATAAGTGNPTGADAEKQSRCISCNFLNAAETSLVLNFDKLFKNYSMSETLNILEEVGNGQTLIRSSVITLDNIGAVIDTSETAYVETQGAKAGGLYNVTVSTKLTVVPHIIIGEFDANGMPRIKLLIEVQDGGFSKSPLTTGSTPSTTTRTVNTEASVYEGQSLFIGGSFKEIHEVNSAGIPILKDIPIIGNLFKLSNRGNSVTERIYIITPTTIHPDNSQTEQLSRFFTESHLSGEPTLKPDQFILTNDYERPSFEKATYKPEKMKLNWGKMFRRGSEDEDESEVEKVERRRQRARVCRRR